MMESDTEAVRNLLTDIEEGVNYFVRKSDLWQALSKQGADEVEQFVSQLICESQLVQERLDRNTNRINELNFERAAICKAILSSAKVGVSEMELGVIERAIHNLEMYNCQLQERVSLAQQQLDIGGEAAKAIAKGAKDLQSKIQEHKQAQHELMKVRVQQLKEQAEKFAGWRIDALEASNEELAEAIVSIEATLASKKAQWESLTGVGEAEAGGTSSPVVSLEGLQRYMEADIQLARLELERDRGSALLDQVAQAMRNILDLNSPPAITTDETCEEPEESLGKEDNQL